AIGRGGEGFARPIGAGMRDCLLRWRLDSPFRSPSRPWPAHPAPIALCRIGRLARGRKPVLAGFARLCTIESDH
ncbi:hypothetical protein AB4084_26535, partial [Lysobacter sp. 2RAB21]